MPGVRAAVGKGRAGALVGVPGWGRSVIAWPAVEAALRTRPGWRRVGGELHGPCPVDLAGTDCAWFAPGDGSGGVRAGCRHCGGGSGRLDGEALRSHLAAVAGDEAGPHRGPLRRSGSGASASSGGVTNAHTGGGAARCAAVWAASVSADRTAGAVYLTGRGAWPAGERLPASVRWLPATSAACLQPRRLPSGAAGALCFLFGAPGEADPAAIQCEAVNAGGGRLPFGDGAKRPTLGGPGCMAGGRRVFVARSGGAEGGGVHLCEGPLDGLALVHLARLGAVDLAGAAVIATAGAGGWTLAAVAGWPGPVTLWVQGDGPGYRAAGRLMVALHRGGRAVRLEVAPAGMDWADVATIELEEREAMRGRD